MAQTSHFCNQFGGLCDQFQHLMDQNCQKPPKRGVLRLGVGYAVWSATIQTKDKQLYETNLSSMTCIHNENANSLNSLYLNVTVP